MDLLTKEEEYLFELSKKLKSFKQRSPIFIYFTVMPSSIIIEEVITKNTYKFEIDFNKSISDQIKNIKSFLKEKLYPKLTTETKKFVEPKIEDLNKYMEEHQCSFDKAFKNLSLSTIKQEFVIDKINIKKNTLIIENKDKEQFLYQLNMPITLYLKHIREVKDSKLAYNKLIDNSTFLYKIERKDNEEKRMGN